MSEGYIKDLSLCPDCLEIFRASYRMASYNGDMKNPIKTVKCDFCKKTRAGALYRVLGKKEVVKG